MPDNVIALHPPGGKPPLDQPFQIFGAHLEANACIAEEKRRRAHLMINAAKSGRYMALLNERASRDVVWWTNNFAWVFEPRLVQYLPMVLWPKQVAYLRFVHEHVEAQQEWLTEKSRDVGVTYLHVLYAVWRWLYTPGFKSTFGSNLERNVDKLGNPDTILEKARIALHRLPKWMLPPGFVFGRDDSYMLLKNPHNNNTINGEAGPQMGRSGRSSVYFLDEAAFIDRDEQVNRATSANAGVRNWASTANFTANVFYQMKQAGNVPVFRFHWRDDPRKDDAWAARKKKDIGATAFASEFDIDYAASVKGILVERKWVDAALRLERVVREKLGIALPTTGHKIAGLDVGAGKDESVFIGRTGSVCHMPVVWEETDSIDLANMAIDEAERLGINRVNFDAIGVGHGITSGFAHAENTAVRGCPVIVGENASEHVVWPDDLTSRQKFVNLRADLWWRGRECMIRTYETVIFLETDGDAGQMHDLSVCCSLPDDPVLADQLNWLRWRRYHDRRIIVQSKDELPKSPDRADAFILSFEDGGLEDWTAGDFVMAPSKLEMDW